MKKDRVILPSSNEAAQPVTVTAWKSRDGYTYLDERSARYAGCTHRECSGCGQPARKGWLQCKACREKAEIEKYSKLERRPWDGKSMIYSEVADHWFRDMDDLNDYCEENEVSPSALRLVLGKPLYFRELSAIDHCEGVLPEEGDVPEEIEEAFERLNEAIRAYGKPLSYEPSKFALDLTAQVEAANTTE